MATAIRNLKNISDQEIVIEDMNGLTIAVNDIADGNMFGDSVLKNSLDVLRLIAEGKIEVSDGNLAYLGQRAVDLIKGTVDQFTKDGKKIFTMSDRPQDHYRYFTTCGDDTTNLLRGEGECLIFDVAHGAEQSIDVAFIDDTYLKDGSMLYSNAAMGSWLRVDVACPAGLPYPARNHDGNLDIIGGVPTPNTEGTGAYNVSGVEVTLHRFINHMAMYAIDRERENIDTAEPNFIPKNWIVRCTIHNENTEAQGNLKACITLGMYRKITL